MNIVKRFVFCFYLLSAMILRLNCTDLPIIRFTGSTAGRFGYFSSMGGVAPTSSTESVSVMVYHKLYDGIVIRYNTDFDYLRGITGTDRSSVNRFSIDNGYRFMHRNGGIYWYLSQSFAVDLDNSRYKLGILSDIGFRYSYKLIRFGLYYRNNCNIEPDHIMNHNIRAQFIWAFPQAEYLKFYLNTTVSLKHFTDQISSDQSILTNMKISFDMILDLNKLNNSLEVISIIEEDMEDQ